MIELYLYRRIDGCETWQCTLYRDGKTAYGWGRTCWQARALALDLLKALESSR